MAMLNMNETIRSRRRALGMTQDQLADRLGVSAPAVSKWEQSEEYAFLREDEAFRTLLAEYRKAV